MTKPKVTVTLGRSGQVVRRDYFDGGGDGLFLSSGGKRSIRDRLGNSGESSSNSGGKRHRPIGDALRPDKLIGKNDLRLKLLHKKSLQIHRDSEKLRLRKIDLREKLQRNVTPSHTVRVIPPQQHRPPEITIPRQRTPPRVLNNPRFMESSQRLYTSWGMEEMRPSSPELMSRATRGISPPRMSSQMREVPSVRSANGSRSLEVRGDDVLLNYRPVGPPPYLPLRAAAVSSQAVRPPPASTSSIRQSPSMDEEPLTVSGLLQSLGLSKYYINFQAEEVDMLTLKQMGDIDLKEMGIPMGPRKKILLAIKSRTFRRPP